MAYAHRGIELKPLPGIDPTKPTPQEDTVARTDSGPQRPITLSTRASSVLLRIEKLMRESTVKTSQTARQTKEAADRPAVPITSN